LSLPASQRRALVRIERKLRASDPRLISMFAIFTRLNFDEDMPRLEEIKARLTKIVVWIRRRLAPALRLLALPLRLVALPLRLLAVGARRVPRPSPKVQAVIFGPLALAAMTGALLVTGGFSSAQRCASAVHAPTAELIVKARACRVGLIGPPRLLILGH
jgi:hypothetical protein